MGGLPWQTFSEKKIRQQYLTMRATLEVGKSREKVENYAPVFELSRQKN